MGYDTNYDRAYNAAAEPAEPVPSRGGALGGPRGIALGGPRGGGLGLGTISEPIEPVPPRSGALGGPRGIALGGPRSAGLGLPEDPIPALFADEGISVVLDRERGPGSDRRVLGTVDRPRSALNSLDITLEANAIADWKVVVPGDRSLDSWTGTSAFVGFDGEQLFRGEIEEVAHSQSSAETTLSGPGPLGTRTDGNVSVTYRDVDAHVALRLFGQSWLPGIRHEVIDPAPDQVKHYDELSVSGSPMECWATLHKRAGMAWTVRHDRPDPFAESYVPGSQLREATWLTEDYDYQRNISDYHNQIVVKGALKPGESDPGGDRYTAVARDAEQIREVTNGEPKTYREVDDELTSADDCLAYAQSLLEEHLGKREFSGSIDVAPRFVQPGHYYRVREFESDGAAVYLPLAKTRITESASEASGGLSFGAEDGLESILRGLSAGPEPTDLRRAGAAWNSEGVLHWGQGEWGDGTWGGTTAEG